MAELVVGVVGDVLRHVAVEVLQRRHVGRVTAVHAAELVVLLPEVALDQLNRREQTENRDVAARSTGRCRKGGAGEERAAGQRRRTGQANALQE